MTRIPRPGVVLKSATVLLLASAALGGCKKQAPAPADAADGSAAVPASTVPAPVAPRIRTAPRDDVDAVMKRFLAATSYHVNMDTRAGERGMKMEMDFVAPDRYRMSTPMGTQHIIGDTMYMEMQGRRMKVPMTPGQTAQFRDSARFTEHQETMTVEDLGTEAVDGTAAHKFRIRNTQPQPTDTLMWVGDDGYPVQVQVSAETAGQPTQTTIRYSRFNDPKIRIEPPQ